MFKKLFVLAAAYLSTNAASSQTLFTYGNHQVETKDFLRAYKKNNSAEPGIKKQSVKDYLDLYINSRLKIQEAYDRRYDTLPQIKTEIENLRTQIIDNYMNDPKILNRLIDQAFKRSQKDIHVAHIFINSKKPDGTIDSLGAKQKALEIYRRLKSGEDFSKLAQQYSDDPAAKNNKGDLGFITVFTLPYELENIAYATAAGKYSSPYHSKAGYHIIKNLGERKAIGKIKAQQILLAFPPDTDEQTKKEIGRLADSIYHRLLKGDDMSKLAQQFSNDFATAPAGGIMPAFGAGQYSNDFENYILSLPKDGEIGKPFLSKFGYHIIKRLGIVPVVRDPNDKKNRDDLRVLVQQNDRMQISRNAIYARALKKAGFVKMPYNEKELWSITDSLIDLRPATIPVHLKRESALFRIGKKPSTVNDWITYAQVNRFKSDGTGLRPYSEVMDDFVNHEAQQYYHDHLEDYNEDFRNQMNEFKDGNLFFEIMQREIWNKAQNDSVALVSYFEKNKNRYYWKQSADAVIFFCSDVSTSKLVYEELKKNPAKWHSAVEALSEKVVADSSRYEWTQIPDADKKPLSAGIITKPVINQNDNTASFAYVTAVYPHPESRTFAQAKGLVINDYQNELEEKWIHELKKKYPVKINQDELRKILK